MSRGGVEIVGSRPCRVCSAPVFPEQRFCGECGAGTRLDAPPDASELDATVADPLVGRVVADRYRMVRCIGRGGMGVVYEVEHVHIGKRLAMKLLHGELAGDPATVRRLRHEAEAASRLSDSSTVQVFDFGTSDGLAYLVMELVEGEDLAQICRREGRLAFERIARLLLDVCGSLAEAHGQGIVHRDLKPENIMVLRSGAGERAKVLDFGLAMLRATAHQSVSRTGSIVGTPHYMAPEQIRGEDVDPRADIYALGGVLYRALTGAPPFTGESAIVVLTQHLGSAPKPPSSLVPVDSSIDAIVMRCLAKSPRDRYQNVGEFAAALTSYLEAHGEAVAGGRGEASVASRLAVIATRRDIDDYETRLRRRGRTTSAAIVTGAILVSALVVLGVYQRARDQGATSTVEAEPNGEPALASPLVRSRAVRGRLGRRTDRERGDIDAYRLVPGDAGWPTRISASVTPLPNVDLVLELYREGDEDAVLRIDASGVGHGEGLVAFPIERRPHLLVVRERWIRGTYPIENVSDWYAIRWDAGESAEAEPNDSPDVARRIEPERALRGSIGWQGDVDVICAPHGSVGRFTISPASGVNLSVASPDRDAPEIDAGEAGAVETFEVASSATRPCVRIRRVEPPRDEARVVGADYGVLFVASP